MAGAAKKTAKKAAKKTHANGTTATKREGRRVVYSVAMSLDGFIAGPKGEYDWIVMDPEMDFNAIFAQFDTLLMGRRTFAPMAAAGQGSGGGGWPGIRSVVFSKTLKQSDYPDVTIVSDDIVDAVTQLKSEPGKDIWLFGGGELFRSLLDAGVVDSVNVAVIPVLLGGGVPFLPAPAKHTKLKLAKHRLYAKSGIVSLEYDVV